MAVEEDEMGGGLGWGLDDAIAALKADVARANAGGTDLPRFPITSVTVELKVVATRSKGGKAGFKIPFVEVELGGELSRRDEVTSTITLQLGVPIDSQGHQVRVSETTDQIKR